MKLLLSFCCLLLASVHLLGQQENLLPPNDFLRQVFSNHPDAIRAGLLGEMASANLLAARGGFDPVLYGDYSSKRFKESSYWDVSEGGLKIPTVGGLEFSAGFRAASGSYLNAERTLFSRGQAFVSIKAQLLQGLLTDERRTKLKRADLLQNWNAIESRFVLNELGYNALLTYLDYSLALSELELLQSSLSLAEQRLAQTRTAFQLGDRPALDTLETAMQVNQRKVEIANAQTAIAALERSMNTLLWESEMPVVATSQLPGIVDLDGFKLYLSSQSSTVNALNNPDLLVYDFKLADLAFERRLKQQKVLPKLSVKYESIGDVFDFTPKDEPGNSIGDFILDNNKFEVEFKAPIFQRGARGELKLNTLKMQDVEWQRKLKLRSLDQKQRQYEDQLTQLTAQFNLEQSLATNYYDLLEAERFKFDVGDSSVFLLNSRENKWLAARRKLLKTQKELNKLELSLQYLSGNIAGW